MCTIYCGLYFQAGRGDAALENEAVKWLIFMIVFIPSIGFMVFFIDKLRIEFLKMLAKTGCTLLFKILSFGRTNRHDFIDQHRDENEDSNEMFELANERHH